MSLVPFTAKDCVVCIYYYYVKRQVVKGILTEKQFKFQSMANVSLLLIVRA